MNKKVYLSELMAAVAESDNDVASRALGKAIDKYGSDTPDNRSCVDSLEVGTYQVADYVFRGIGLASSEESLSTVINYAEGCPVPEQVKEAVPSITQEEWDAALRFCTLALTALERKN